MKVVTVTLPELHLLKEKLQPRNRVQGAGAYIEDKFYMFANPLTSDEIREVAPNAFIHVIQGPAEYRIKFNFEALEKTIDQSVFDVFIYALNTIGGNIALFLHAAPESISVLKEGEVIS